MINMLLYYSAQQYHYPPRSLALDDATCDTPERFSCEDKTQSKQAAREGFFR